MKIDLRDLERYESYSDEFTTYMKFRERRKHPEKKETEKHMRSRKLHKPRKERDW